MKPIIGVVPLVDEAKNSLWMLPGYMEGVEMLSGRLNGALFIRLFQAA